MSVVEAESQFLESIIPKLAAEGYDVFVHPSPHLLPPFMQKYVPDAIALGSPKNLAIEVVADDSRSESEVRTHQKLFKDAKDWEFRVYYFRPAARSDVVDVAPRGEIENSLERVEQMRADGLTSPALLMGWATLEALARSLVPGKFARPQTPDRLIEGLASEGQLTPGEADALRRLGVIRNSLAHGDLRAGVADRDLDELITILRSLYALPLHA